MSLSGGEEDSWLKWHSKFYVAKEALLIGVNVFAILTLNMYYLSTILCISAFSKYQVL